MRKDEIAKAVKKIAAAAVSDIQKLGEVFDREFPTEYIAKFDECRHTAATESEIQAKLISIAKSLPDISIETDVIKPNVVKLGLLDGNTDNFVTSLNILVSTNQNEGITLLAACDNTLKADVVDFIQKEFAYPAQGLIISDNNQIGTQEVVKKKAQTDESVTGEFKEFFEFVEWLKHEGNEKRLFDFLNSKRRIGDMLDVFTKFCQKFERQFGKQGIGTQIGQGAGAFLKKVGKTFFSGLNQS